jgi:hypothetical protein
MEAIEKPPTRDTTYHATNNTDPFTFFVHIGMCFAASDHKAKIPNIALIIESNINTVNATP